MAAKRKVLMLCTGGTIGMLHKVKDDPTSPLVPAKWKEIENNFTALKELRERFDVVTDEMKLIDSSDMHPEYWTDLAKKIGDHYNEYDGFVVLHGTDTMSYTATALSFMLENLDKPVIVTGSQLPLAKARTDAVQNLVTALIIAASDGVPTIPEVCILFNNVLLRGNRSRKVSSSGFAGFDSPNYPPLAKIGEHIDIYTKVIRKPSAEGFFVSEFLEPNVLTFDIFPGIRAEILEKVFDIEGLKGVVMKTYGAGNIPSAPELLENIGDAINGKNIAVINITQCQQGMVEMGLYDASMGLLRNGVISGVDMTPEAALVKMMFLLGQGYDIDTVKDLMQRNLRGEQSVNVFNFMYKKGETKNNICNMQAQPLPAGFEIGKIVKANIRFSKIAITNKKNKKPLNLSIFMNYPKADVATSTDIPQCIGVLENVSEEADCMLECTQKASQVIAPGRPVQLTVVSQNGNLSWDDVVLSIYTDVMD